MGWLPRQDFYADYMRLELRSALVMRRAMRAKGRPARVVYYTRAARHAIGYLRLSKKIY